jgi:adenosylhomocysteinase
MHLTRETVALGAALRGAGGAVIFFPSNRNPAPEDVAESARRTGILVNTRAAIERLQFEKWRVKPPFLVVEGNGRFFRATHEPAPRAPLIDAIAGISEHTSGGGRLVEACDPGRIRVPVVAVYREPLKGRIETGLGTAQTVLAALLRGLQMPVAGRVAVVVGFGHVGRGVARGLRTLGARVVVVETQAEAKMFAHLEGFPVSTLEGALVDADLCITATGTPRVVGAEHLERIRLGLVLANVSNEPREIDLNGCVPRNSGEETDLLTAWSAADGLLFYLLGGGLQVNHVVEEGNPAELMDLSFSLHLLVLRWLVEQQPGPGVHAVPGPLAQRVAEVYLEASL